MCLNPLETWIRFQIQYPQGIVPRTSRVLIHLKRGSGFRSRMKSLQNCSVFSCLNPLETWIRFQIQDNRPEKARIC